MSVTALREVILLTLLLEIGPCMETQPLLEEDSERFGI
jgi:hypothetical protein